MFKKWLADNWNRWAVIAGIHNYFQQRKALGDQAVPGEPSEITYIRQSWRRIRKPMCLLSFFDVYFNAKRINKSNLKAQRERIKGLGRVLKNRATPGLEELVGWQCLALKGGSR
jgi:hypothetical protein